VLRGLDDLPGQRVPQQVAAVQGAQPEVLEAVVGAVRQCLVDERVQPARVQGDEPGRAVGDQALAVADGDRGGEAVRALAGGSPMNPRVARRVLDMFSKLSPEKKDYGLTERETAVLKLMTSGIGNREIAEALKISDGTVRNHVSSIFSKLGVNDRTKAVLYALQKRLV